MSLVQRELQNSQSFTVPCFHLTASGQKQSKKELDRAEDLGSSSYEVKSFWIMCNVDFHSEQKDQLWNVIKKSLTSWKHVSHPFNGSVDELGEGSREQRGIIWVGGYSWAISTISTQALCSSLCFPASSSVFHRHPGWELQLLQGAHQRQETSVCCGIMIIITANTPFGWLSASARAQNWLSLVN